MTPSSVLKRSEAWRLRGGERAPASSRVPFPATADVERWEQSCPNITKSIQGLNHLVWLCMDGVLQVPCTPGTCSKDWTYQITARESGLKNPINNQFKSPAFDSVI